MHKNVIKKLNERYTNPSFLRSCYEVSVTFILYFACFFCLAYSSLWYLKILIIIPLSLIIVRIFILQHECGHGNLFKSKTINNTIGFLCSLVTLTPYYHWRAGHLYHHSHFGIKTDIKIGYIDLLSTTDYNRLSSWQKFMYRQLRSPFMLLFILSPIMFFIIYRLPISSKTLLQSPHASKNDKKHYFYILTAWTLMFLFLITYWLGITVLIYYLAASTLAIAIGALLFYVQHNFDKAYFVEKDAWRLLDSAIHGSTYFKLPPVLRWFTGNIGYHHLHHLCPRIPFYRLKSIYDKKIPGCEPATIITLKNIPYLFSLKLFDEEKQKMITWKTYRGK